MAHHPDKFLDGRMLWHGRIYSPLPFVRSLWGERINAGVWGTAAFPSVYRRDVHPFAFLPHSVRWQVLSFCLTIAGALTAASGKHSLAAILLLATGVVGAAMTIAKNISYAMRSNVGSLGGSSLWYRAVVAYLHFLQPFARIRGQIRGILSPPEMTQPAVAPQTSRGPRPSLREACRALLIVSGGITEDRYWSETWTTADRVLSQLTDWLRRSRAVRVIEVDDGWSDDRDVSVLVGRWSWLDVRALVEEHGGGKSLLRVTTHLRPTSFGIAAAVVLAAVLVGADLMAVRLVAGLQSAGLQSMPPLAANATWTTAYRVIGVAAAAFALAAVGFAAWRTAQATAILRRGVEAVALRQGMVAMPSAPARTPLVAPSLLRSYGLRSAIIFIVVIVAIGAGTFMLREAATARVVINARRNVGPSPTIAAWADTPSGLAVAPNGALYFADSQNDVVWRQDPGANLVAIAGGLSDTPAGSPVKVTYNGKGFSGDNGLAVRAQLDRPGGVCLASDGDLIVADSHNDRIRRIDRPTHIITTIAGSGENGYDGDDKPATEAALNTPNAVACAPNGDIYIADTQNYRVRMIDAKTGLIHTVAGDGTPGDAEQIGDGGPATLAHLNMPNDVAVAPNGNLYIADMDHDRVRKVDAKTHIISTIAGDGTWGETGDNGSAVEASLSGPIGLALGVEPKGIMVYIADYYNGLVRAVGPDGVMRNVSSEGRAAFGAPTRIAFDQKSGWLYVYDASTDSVITFNIPKSRAQSGPGLRFSLPRKTAG
jgi:sugar lactone lactonase YvrE